MVCITRCRLHQCVQHLGLLLLSQISKAKTSITIALRSVTTSQQEKIDQLQLVFSLLIVFDSYNNDSTCSLYNAW